MQVLPLHELRRRPSTYGVIGVVVLLWLIVVLARVLWNGDVYGLDYSLWFPDGTYYSYRAFVWGQVDPGEATRLLNEMYGYPQPPIPPGLPEKPPFFQGRVLYPLLSAPFAGAFGSFGLLIIPALGLLVCVLTPTIMLLRRGLPIAALFLSGLALASTSLARWSIANLTEGLLLGLFALMLPLLPWDGRRSQPWKLASLVLLAIGIGLTRQSLPPVVLMIAFPWLAEVVRSKKIRSVWLAPLALVSVPSILVFVATSPRGTTWLLPLSFDADQLQDSSPLDRIARFPVEVVRMFVIEVGQLAVLDRALLVLLLLSVTGAIWSRRYSLAWAWWGVGAGSLFLTAWVGAGGVNFRYALPLIPISMLASATLLRRPLEHSRRGA